MPGLGFKLQITVMEGKTKIVKTISKIIENATEYLHLPAQFCALTITATHKSTKTPIRFILLLKIVAVELL